MGRMIHRRKYWLSAAALALTLGGFTPLLSGHSPAAAKAKAPAGYISLFDGKSLKGWHGDPTIWSVRDGAITGGSAEPIPGNTFLIHDGNYSNFELHYKYRFSGSGNSGVNFRSIVADPAKFVVKGYQANVVPVDERERFGMLWEEGGRSELALLGEKVEFSGTTTRTLVRNVTGTTNPMATLLGIVRPYPEWNDVVVVAYGNHFVHAINGYLVFDATDNDAVGAKDGIFALQTHSGPPMFIQFKDMEVKPLTAAPTLAGRFKSDAGPAPAVQPKIPPRQRRD